MKRQIKYKIIAFVLCLTMLFTNVIPLTSSFVYGANTTKDSIGSINQEDDGVTVVNMAPTNRTAAKSTK